MRGKRFMYDLNTFYRSKDWQKLLRTLKVERLNEEGQIICEYCGKPIVKAYDMIGHHKVELTEENVNDFDVSLNPDNVSFVHHRCHNYIHDKFGYSKREIYIVYGPPLAGKREWVKDNMSEGDLVIDIDDIWQCVSGCARYVKPNRLKAIVFRMRDNLLDAVRYRYGKWNNAYIVGGYPLQSERERLCKELGAREIFLDVPEAECMARLESSEEIKNKDDFKKFVREWFERYTPAPVSFG